MTALSTLRKHRNYLAAFAGSQSLSGQFVASELVHSDVPFFPIINRCVNTGYENFFFELPLNVRDYHTVWETLDCLMVDMLKGQKHREIVEGLKNGRPDWFMHREAITEHLTLVVARDAAFKLVYLFALGRSMSESE